MKLTLIDSDKNIVAEFKVEIDRHMFIVMTSSIILSISEMFCLSPNFMFGHNLSFIDLKFLMLSKLY